MKVDEPMPTIVTSDPVGEGRRLYDSYRKNEKIFSVRFVSQTKDGPVVVIWKDWDGKEAGVMFTHQGLRQN